MLWSVAMQTLIWLVPIAVCQILLAVLYFHHMNNLAKHNNQQVFYDTEPSKGIKTVSLDSITPKRDYKADLISEGFVIHGYDVMKHGKVWFTAERKGNKLDVYALNGRGYKYLDTVSLSKYLPYLLVNQNLLTLDLVDDKLIKGVLK